MRITLDCAVLVRAHQNARGPARALLLEMLEAGHRLVLSAPMLDELGRVLSYPRLLRRSRLTPSGISEYLRFLPASAWLVEIDESVSAPIRDADDMHVILTAIVGSVEFLCTLDAHFYEPPVVTFCERLRIRVVDDVDLLHIIRTL